MSAKVLAFDLDGICSNETETDLLPGSWTCRSPNDRVRQLMYRARNAGYTVVVYTGRGEIYRRITEDWLQINGFPYHFLVMGKAYYTYLVDDRARTVAEVEDILGG